MIDYVLHGSPLRGVDWSLALVAFLAYIVIITTYAFRGGNVMMAVALLGTIFIFDRITVAPVLAWMALYLCWAVIGYTQTDHPDVVLQSLIDYGKLWLIALVALTVLSTRYNTRLFTVVFLGCFALYPTRGAIFNYLGGYTTFGRALWNYIYANPNDLAALALLQLSMAVGLLRAEGERWIRYCALAGLAVLPLLILMTQSRGAFIALAVFVLLYIAAQRGRRARSFIGLAALGAVVAMFAPSGVWERVRGLSKATSTEQLDEADEEGSARQRYEIWRVAGQIIADHPVTGVGHGAYPYVHKQYATHPGLARTARGMRDAHSTFLRVAAETGLPGLAIFLGILGAPLLAAESVRRRIRAVLPGQAAQLYALEIGLISFLFAGLWGSFSGLTFLYLHLVLLTAVARHSAHAFDEVSRGAGVHAAEGRRSVRTRVATRAATVRAPSIT